MKYGVKLAGSLTQRQELLSQLVSIDSIILEGWKIHVESVSDRKVRHEYLSSQYENERLTLIQALCKYSSIFHIEANRRYAVLIANICADDVGEFEPAASLAEKYFDFTILVKICDKTEDDERLIYYMDKYEKKVSYSVFTRKLKNAI